MKCAIPGPNIKVFGRAIHSLSKIGDELYVNPEKDCVVFKTVNSSWSAYGSYKFTNQFFSSVQLDETSLVNSKCKVGLKPCLGVFRSLATIDKIVEKCVIQLKNEDFKLVFQLFCKHGIVKTYNLSYIESETLDSVFDKDACSNVILAHSRLLADSVSNFLMTQDEVTLSVQDKMAIIKNYVDDEPDPSKVVHTVLSIEADEFTEFKIKEKTEITFCLKELRALLSFSEATNLPVYIHFENSGKPIIFHISNEPAFEASLVLATLDEKALSQSTQASTIDVLRQNSYHSEPMISVNSQTLNQASNRDDSRPSLDEPTHDQTSNDDNHISVPNVQMDDHVVSGSPPTKKHKQDKAIFMGLFDSTKIPEISYTQSDILAPESDDET